MSRVRHHKRYKKHVHHIKTAGVLAISGFFVCVGIAALWVATLQIPDIRSFGTRSVSQSTKIYDRTGTILLFDTGANSKRTVLPLSDISPLIQSATISIEDSNFYHNIGIEPLSIIRAIIANVLSIGYSQGASTITQQVVKNSLLTQDKTITRKIKEWVLAIKLTRVMSKEDILATYLNESSYGGTVYGVEEASQQFFGHPAKDVSLAEAAYLAAIPQAPTYYSPYGTHTDQLTKRARLVLSRMKELGAISDTDYKKAIDEKVSFFSKNTASIRAPHFVMFIKDYLVNTYGEDVVANGGLRVITSLDYTLQQKAEDVATKFAPSLLSNFKASNISMVGIDPKTGDVLMMVGSKDYFDQTIDGNYNVAIARRQPGSTFKPFVYATTFKKGLTPETILWDTKTEFSILCNPDGTMKNPDGTQNPYVATTSELAKNCYSPGEYDDVYEGPVTIRHSLATSRNIPAVQALYIAGTQNAIDTAEGMGIHIRDPHACGLTLVLGGCEVSLLDLTSAYGVFANDGVRNPYRYILEITDPKGNVLEKATTNPEEVLDSSVARQITSILSDTTVRMASLKPIGESVGRPVAIKTGTTNDYRDVWTVGYTPSLVVGAWAGNNDNSPMQHTVAGLIISPVWGAFMSQAAKTFPLESFGQPPAPLIDGKPIFRGIWQGGVSYWKDTISGKVATSYTPQQTREEVVFHNVHSPLYWMDIDDPKGPAPMENSKDSQFPYWEYSVAEWFKTWRTSHPEFQDNVAVSIPTATDDIHIPENFPQISILQPQNGLLVDPNKPLTVVLQKNGKFPPQKTEVYLNNKYVMTTYSNPLLFSFVPSDIGDLEEKNYLSITLYDSVFNKTQATTTFNVSK